MEGTRTKRKKHKRKKTICFERNLFTLLVIVNLINVTLLFRWPGILFIDVRSQERDNAP